MVKSGVGMSTGRDRYSRRTCTDDADVKFGLSIGRRMLQVFEQKNSGRTVSLTARGLNLLPEPIFPPLAARRQGISWKQTHAASRLR
jgi:hypothetical protein